MNYQTDSRNILDASLTKDMKAMARQRYNPFIKNGKVDIDAYIQFVSEFNEFIKHAPKPFRQIIDREMIL